MKTLGKGLCALAAACLAASAGAAQGDAKGLAAGLRLSDARGPIRTVDLSPFKGEVSREILAGPGNGLESAFIVYTRLSAGAKPTGLYTLPTDHTYLVLSGKLNVQLGTDQFVAEPETLVLVPAGVPHRIWNTGTEAVAEFEVISPAPSRDLASMMQPAQARKIDNAAQYVRPAPKLEKLAGGTGHDSLNERILASRATGSMNIYERLNDVPAGGGRTDVHIHPFDQVYFVTKGTMSVLYGLKTYEAGENALVVLPAGVVHSNQNTGTSVQSSITLLLPEPEPGVPLGAGVQISRPPAGGQGGQGGQGTRAPRSQNQQTSAAPTAAATAAPVAAAAQDGERQHTDRTVRFKQLDRNGDGRITLEEFVTRPEASNPTVPSNPDAKTRADRTQRFKDGDKNDDGFLTFEEFVGLESIPVRTATSTTSATSASAADGAKGASK